MSGSKSKLRKQPLICVPEPEPYDDNNSATKSDNRLVVRIRKVGTAMPGKENKKTSYKVDSPSTRKSNEKRKEKECVETDSDSDIDDLLLSLKRSGLKTGSLSKNIRSPHNGDVKKELFPQIDNALSPRNGKRGTPKQNHLLEDSITTQSPKGRSKRARSVDSDKSDDSLTGKRPSKRVKRNSTQINGLCEIKETEEISTFVKDVEIRAKEANDLFMKQLKLVSGDDSSPKVHRKRGRSEELETTPLKRKRTETPTRKEIQKTPLSSRGKRTRTPCTPIVDEPASPEFLDDESSSPLFDKRAKKTTARSSKKKETPAKKMTPLKNGTPKSKEVLCTPRSQSPEFVDDESSSSRSVSKRKTPAKANKKKETPSKKATPLKTGTPLSKDLLCTPVSRSRRTFGTPRTPLEEARAHLHVSSVPLSLPCREQEFQNILHFVENKVMDGVGGCMYISGVPGTGKTATVTQVIRKLQTASAAGELPAFKYIEINGMRLSDPRQAYVELYKNIFGKKERISSDAAYKKLDNYFNKSDSKKITTVVLVDELDLMCTRKQDVVYNLLDWPSRSRSKLVVLTIANTMDMPERKLKGRVNSRLGLTRLTFLPYTHKQLEEIVMARLQGTEAFVVDAVRLATRKVAAVSGDARRALDICRRATELPNPDEPVRITHIEQAIKEMTNSNIVRLIRCCSEVEKLFLRAMSDVCVRTGLEEVELLQVVEHLIQMCVLEGMPKPPVPSLLGVCHRLKCFRLLFSNCYSAGLMQRLTLNLTQDDLHYALKAEF